VVPNLPLFRHLLLQIWHVRWVAQRRRMEVMTC